jgi:succinate dehydrogenase / fumarate reductase cytochrome b subunit
MTHRITGVALSAGTLLVMYWLLALAAGPDAYERAQSIMTSSFGQLVLVGFTWALYYHLCNGIRHLIWDIGYNLDIEGAESSGKLVIVTSILLTTFSWIFGHALSGSPV